MDEAYLDVTDSIGPERGPGVIATQLKSRVASELGLTISVGVATSKSVAKIASDMDKPDGLTIVAPGSERAFLAPLDVGKLWGVGPKTVERLARDGVRTVTDLAAKSDEWLQGRFGRMGPYMRRLAQGEDESPVQVERERKSVSAETTLASDTGDPDLLLDLVDRLSQRVGRSLEGRELRARTVRVKLRLADFTTFTRQTTPTEPVSSADAIATSAAELVRRELVPGRLFRLVGVGVSGFEVTDDGPLQPRLAGFE